MRLDLPRSVAAGALVGVLALVAIVAVVRTRAGGDDDVAFRFPHENAQMIRVLRPADANGLLDDRSFVTQMTGGHSTDDALVGFAVCANGLDWMWDITLNTDLVISTDPALVRAAELYAEAIATGDDAAAELIARAEQAYWHGDADLDHLRDWATDLPDDDQQESARRYLNEREQPPSEAASQRFVVYAVADILTESAIFYFDSFRTSPDALRRPASRAFPSTVLVAGENERREINLASCGGFAAFQRFDPALPELPPLPDRWQLELDESG